MAEVQVISASPTKLELAASVDDIDQKRADIELAFPGPIPARSLPKVGDKINFEGTPVSYTPSPFVMVMEKGALLDQGSTCPGKEATGAQEATVKQVFSQDEKGSPEGLPYFLANWSVALRFGRDDSEWKTATAPPSSHTRPDARSVADVSPHRAAAVRQS